LLLPVVVGVDEMPPEAVVLAAIVLALVFLLLLEQTTQLLSEQVALALHLEISRLPQTTPYLAPSHLLVVVVVATMLMEQVLTEVVVVAAVPQPTPVD
jgi:hypothetical protein